VVSVVSDWIKTGLNIFYNDGNVGIGTNSPTNRLYIQAGQPQVLITSGSGGGRVVNFGNSGHGVGRNTGVSYFTSGNDVVLWTAGDGHCGLRTNGGGFRLLNDGRAEFENDDWHGSLNDGVGRFYYGLNGTTFYKGNGGNPHIWRKANDGDIMRLTDWGGVYAWTFYNESDERIKWDIEDIDDTIGLEKILLIQPKKYKYIDTSRGETEVIGFIAQQIHQIIPEAVDFGERKLPNDGETVQDFHYLDKAMIFTLNVAATQELHRIIMRQQIVIDGLITRIEALEAV